MDIEGGEYEAIKGGLKTILRGKPVIVFDASRESTGQYGVNPDDFYRLLTELLGYGVSTWNAGYAERLHIRRRSSRGTGIKALNSISSRSPKEN